MTEHLTERQALEQLPTLLRLIDAGKVSVALRSGLPKAASVRIIERHCAGDDFACEPVRAAGWCALLQQAELASTSHAHLKLTERGRQRLGAEPSQQLQALWQAWLGGNSFDLFSRLGPLRLKGKRGLIKPSTRRRAVAELLESLEVGTWVEVDLLLEQARLAGARLEPVRDFARIYVGEPTLGSLAFLGEDAWSLVASRYLYCMLMEIVAVLGIVDLRTQPTHHARSDHAALLTAGELPYLTCYDGLHSIRLTPLGAYCLGRHQDYATSEASKTVNMEGNELVFSATPTPAETLLLDLFCRRRSPMRYRLDLEKTLKAASRGHLPGALRSLTGGAADEFLAEAERRTQAVKCRGRAYLFACANPELARTLLTSPKTSRYCSRAGADQVVVAPADLEKFRRGLLELGYQA